MVEDEWCFNLIVMCFCLHAKCLAFMGFDKTTWKISPSWI